LQYSCFVDTGDLNITLASLLDATFIAQPQYRRSRDSQLYSV